MKTELFKKVYIKSEADLPKDGQYIVHYKRFSETSPAGVVLSHINSYNTEQLRHWMNDIDWYLLPLQIDELSDEEIEDESVGYDLPYDSEGIAIWKEGFITGGECIRDKMIKAYAF